MARSNRLYQVDWLKRIYQYSNDELKLAFDDGGRLPLDADSKTSIAAENLDAFPVDVNTADRTRLLRVPGVGPTSAQRIVTNRRRHTIDTWRDFQAMGVVKKRAWPFLAFLGQRPPRARQLKLELFGQGPRRPDDAGDNGQAPSLGSAIAPCGEARSCVGCSMYGMPGHPGSAESEAPALAGGGAA